MKGTSSRIKAIKRGELLTTPAQIAGASTIGPRTCCICGLREWQGKPIAMHIDHINGVRDNHRLENLRMLCPNCHSQTPTYGGRNAKRRPRRLQDPGGAV